MIQSKFFLTVRNVCPFFKRTFSERIGVVGVPFHRGQETVGVEEAPRALREAGLIKELIKLGHNVKDFGDVAYTSDGRRHDVPDIIKWLPDLASCAKNLSTAVQEVLSDQRKVLTIGGDHSIALGCVDGHVKFKDGQVCLLWVDAHADINTADTTDTGNMHGMGLSLLAKELADYWPYLPGLDWQVPRLSLKNVAYIGLRSVDAYERLIIEKHGVAAFGMEDIEKYGIHEVTRIALEKINPSGEMSLHVSFDIDSLDALEAPSTGTPVRGGLTLREALHVMEVAHRTGYLNAVDIVEVNPRIGTPLQVQQTIDASIHVVKAAFGHSRSGSVPQHVQNLPGFYAAIT